MGQGCSTFCEDFDEFFNAPPEVILAWTDDSEQGRWTTKKCKRDESICPFDFSKSSPGKIEPYMDSRAGIKYSINFVTPGRLRAGPHITFPTPKASPDGLTPIKESKDVFKVLTALWREALFHGGEQLLSVFTCTMTVGSKEDKSPRVLVLTSLGRLFCIKGRAVVTSCHVVEISSAEIDVRAKSSRRRGAPDASASAGSDTGAPADGVPTVKKSKLVLKFSSTDRPDWIISTSTDAAQYLQVYLWLCNAVAHTQLLMHVNMAQLPMQMLPPLAADGNLHAAYVMQANAAGFTEPEEVLKEDRPEGNAIWPPVRKADYTLTPAFLCVRRFTTKMEVDVSDWSVAALPPIAEAMRHNTAMLAFKAKDAPHLGGQLASLAPMLTTNAKLIVLSLERVGGKPEAFVRLFKGLAANPVSLLSVINLNGNHVGNEGGTERACDAFNASTWRRVSRLLSLA